MATRGFVTIKNKDNKDNPYIGSSDILIEAYHDGYGDVILLDILSIPVVMAEMSHMGLIEPINYLIKEESTYDRFVQKEMSIGFIDMTWDSIFSLLVMTKPMMYNRIEPGVLRYGSPVYHSDSCFSIEHDTSERSKDILSIDCILDKRYLEEYLTQRIKTIIDTINKNITREENKIIYDDKNQRITMSIKRIFFDILSDKIKKPSYRQQRNILINACEELIDAPHYEHFASRLNNAEMKGIEEIKKAIKICK